MATSEPSMTVRRLAVMSVAVGVLVVTGVAAVPAGAQEQELPDDPDAERALEIGVEDGFTVASVGDLIISRPVTQNPDPRFQEMVELLGAPDVTFGNFENTALELERFDGYPSAQYGGLRLRVKPDAVQDLKDMGFDLVSRANNHTTDWGIEGLRRTSEVLDEVGLVHAGAGETMAAARAGRFLETPKGRVAVVSMATSFGSDAPAMDPLGAVPGRPGLSSLRTDCDRYVYVTEEEMERLRDVPGAEAEDDEVTLLGTTYRVRPVEERPLAGPGEEEERREYETECEMNENDLREILHAIRQAKRSADFVIATIHAHDPGNWSDVPPPFLEDLARQTIDAGADQFVGHGPHQLRGIEIYEGKPIFYSLANFFFQVELQTPLSEDIYENFDADPDAVTATEFLRRWMERAFDDPIWYESVIAESRYEDGQVAEIRLHPVELLYDEPGRSRGTPRMAGPDTSEKILETLRELSEPYGTEVRVEDGVGVIRVPAATTN